VNKEESATGDPAAAALDVLASDLPSSAEPVVIGGKAFYVKEVSFDRLAGIGAILVRAIRELQSAGQLDIERLSSFTLADIGSIIELIDNLYAKLPDMIKDAAVLAVSAETEADANLIRRAITPLQVTEVTILFMDSNPWEDVVYNAFLIQSRAQSVWNRVREARERAATGNGTGTAARRTITSLSRQP
jgi:hypothetical protein